MKDSTTKFYSYVSLPHYPQRSTADPRRFPHEKDVSKVEYIRRFLKIIADLKVKITVLCLDCGFYLKEVFGFLQNEDVPHIVPVKKQGGELKEILTGNHSRYDRYTMIENGKDPLDLTLAIDV